MDDPFAQLLSRMAKDGEGKARKPRPLPEAQVARLKELFPAFTEPCPYAVGDLVTPRSDSPVRGAGNPHVVVATRPDAGYDFDASVSDGSSAYGRRRDMRVVAFCDDDHFHAHWVESADFEPYALPDAAVGG